MGLSGVLFSEWEETHSKDPITQIPLLTVFLECHGLDQVTPPFESTGFEMPLHHQIL